MRKVICYIAASLDGYIARADGAVDWLDKYMDADYGYAAFMWSIDTVIMGSQTYLKSLEIGPQAFAGEHVYYVMSRSGDLASTEVAQLTAESPSQLLGRLRKSPGKHIWLMGGGVLLQAFLKKDLLDEIMLFVIPELIGSGVPLFPGEGAVRHWRLKNTSSYPNGVVLLHYVR